MLVQITIGSGLILSTIFGAALSFFLLEWIFARAKPWLHREPHGPKQLLVLCVALIWGLGVVTVATWAWAAAFWGLGVFRSLEESLYFALTVFTTLGFGDLLLPQEWRLLAGMSSINGLITIGLFTALLMDVLRQLRIGQAEWRQRRD
jgi:sterol desaturase/sphingolipid hydroxylase (fatty acid hydroxylase superfamily)